MKGLALALLAAALVPGLAPGQPPQEPVSLSVPAVPVLVPHRASSKVRDGAAEVIDRLVATYGQTDFSPLVAYLKGTADASPNAVVPLISLGHAYLCRFDRGGDVADLRRALDFFELPVREDIWPAWGNRWASSITLSHLMKGLLRIGRLAPRGAVLDTRIAVLWSRTAEFAADEADRKLSDDTPYRPYVSLGTGDTKAEENAWEAAFLAWAACFDPGHPRASAWEEKARVLASLSIVRESDWAFFKGSQVVTVSEDFTLENHWLSSNPYYYAATIMLLRTGALAYRMTGRRVPEEFSRNVEALQLKYRSYCRMDAGRLVWTEPSDPQGDPTLWPLPGLDEDSNVRELVSQKVRDGWLWLPTPPVASLVPDVEAGFSPDSVLWRAIQNAKVVWYYLDGAYLWLDPGTPLRGH